MPNAPHGSKPALAAALMFGLSPLWLAIVAGPWTLVKWYNVGEQFRQGLHGFGMMWDLLGLGVAALLSLVLATAILAMLGRRLSTRLRGWIIGIDVLALFALLVCVEAWDGCLAAGRDRAYARLDCAVLAAESRTLAASTQCSTTRPAAFERWGQPTIQLPPYITALRPLEVFATPQVVVLHLDGGGPAMHEGVYVRLVPTTQPTQPGVAPLDAAKGVYRYLLYDSRMPLEP